MRVFLSIRQKLLLLSGILISALIAVGMMGSSVVTQLNEDAEDVIVYFAAARNLSIAKEMLNGLLVVVQRAVSEDTDKETQQQFIAEFSQLSDNLRFALDEIHVMPVREELKNLLVTLSSQLETTLSKGRALLQTASSGQKERARAEVTEFRTGRDKLLIDINQAAKPFETEMNVVREKSYITSARAKQLTHIVLGVGVLFALILSWMTIRAITIPLREMAAVATRISVGDIDQQVTYHANDEVGALAAAFRQSINYLRDLTSAATSVSQGDLTVQPISKSDRDVLSQSFHSMVGTLREMTERMQAGAQTLAYAIGNISTAARQLTTNVTETAEAVSQTASTVEEVKQTAYVAGSKAQEVADNGQRTIRISKSGETAVEQAVSGMTGIRNQITSIVCSVTKLDKQSQAIATIIAAVNDLAEQSNLLAVNAAIEAAKAGQVGKGFGVVAQEVKSLAERSKQATARVRTILNEIQQAIRVTIQESESGAKTAETGAFQAEQAGESIRALSKSITEAANAVTQITASSQQQVIGMEQVATAIANIKTSSAHNADGMRQIESSTQNLHQVGQTLKELAEQFKLAEKNTAVHS